MSGEARRNGELSHTRAHRGAHCGGAARRPVWSCTTGRLHFGDSAKYLLKQHMVEAGITATPDTAPDPGKLSTTSASVYHLGSGPTGQAGT